MKRRGGETIAVTRLEKRTIRHGSLHPALLARIESIARIFAEVNGQPATEWVKDFQRDHDPEKEVVIWEALAAAFTVFTKDRSLTVETKKEAFNLLLMRSMNDEQSVLNEVPLKQLSRGEAVTLFAAFKDVAGAEG